MPKRTKAQITFDLTKRGWYFCNSLMLARKLKLLKELPLEPDDNRHQLIAKMESRLKELRSR